MKDLSWADGLHSTSVLEAVYIHLFSHRFPSDLPSRLCLRISWINTVLPIKLHLKKNRDEVACRRQSQYLGLQPHNLDLTFSRCLWSKSRRTVRLP